MEEQYSFTPNKINSKNFGAFNFQRIVGKETVEQALNDLYNMENVFYSRVMLYIRRGVIPAEYSSYVNTYFKRITELLQKINADSAQQAQQHAQQQAQQAQQAQQPQQNTMTNIPQIETQPLNIVQEPMAVASRKSFNLFSTRVPFNLKKFAQVAPVQALPGQTGQVQEQAQEADKELVAGSSWIQDQIIRWLIKNDQMVVQYLLNPTPENRQLLAQNAVNSIISLGANQLPFGVSHLVNFIASKTLNKIPSFNVLVEKTVKYIFDNLNIGLIPDSISSQSKLLSQYDLPDDIASEVNGVMQNLRQKYNNNPQIINQFLMIILRIKDNRNLINTLVQITNG